MRKETSKKILIIVPCFNEAENIPVLLGEIKNLDLERFNISPLFINDDSTDNTVEILEQHGVKHLSNPVNLGIGGTVQLGFMYAFNNGYDVAVQMDGDGQHPPAELHKLLLPFLNDEADVVIGSRFVTAEGFQSSKLRRIGIRFFYHLTKFLTEARIKDSTSGYRAYNRQAMLHLLDYYPDEYPEPEAVVYLANKKMRLLEIPVTMQERVSGSSSIRRFNTVYYMAKVTFNILFLHLKMKLK